MSDGGALTLQYNEKSEGSQRWLVEGALQHLIFVANATFSQCEPAKFHFTLRTLK